MENRLPSEIAKLIVEQWANTEALIIDVPRARLWILENSIADAIRSERVKAVKGEPASANPLGQFRLLHQRYAGETVCFHCGADALAWGAMEECPRCV